MPACTHSLFSSCVSRLSPFETMIFFLPSIFLQITHTTTVRFPKLSNSPSAHVNLALQTSCHRPVAFVMLVSIFFHMAPESSISYAAAVASAMRKLRRWRFLPVDPIIADSTVASKAGTSRHASRDAESSNLVSKTISTSSILDRGSGGTYLSMPLTLRQDPKHLTLKLTSSRKGPLAILATSQNRALKANFSTKPRIDQAHTNAGIE
jgi:hypothetical protein